VDIQKLLYGSKYQSSFFRKDEEGRDIFYPWCYPGESFYIDSSQKKSINVFFYIFGFLFMLANIGVTFAAKYDLISLFVFFCLFTIVWTVFPFTYCAYMYLVTRNLTPYIPKQKVMPIRSVYFLLAVLLGQVVFTVLGIYVGHSNFSNLILLLLNGLYSLMLVYLIFLTFRNKGYYFTKL